MPSLRENIVISPEEMSRQKQIARDLSTLFQGKQYYINTYGCQMNVQDSQHMAGILEEMGFRPAESQDSADLVFFNTCCVRDNAERRAMGNLGFLHARKKENPDLLLGICGCMVQQDGKADEIRSRFPLVDFCFGTNELYRLPEIFQKRMQSGAPVDMVQPANSTGIIAEGMPIRRTSEIQNFVTIMFGCNNFCSYCIVPYVRGRERSRDPEEIIREVEELAKNGIQEVTLLGQNVNSYGKDLEKPFDFSDLLKRLDGV
ncbi:MAG: radical SAM protein, partial [Clostridia bacterium]|nr:radical SAM protein [Clostridia bacterium]